MKRKKEVKITLKQKILLVFFGIFLALVFLELFLRTGGFILSSYQRVHNKESLDADYTILCLGESTTRRGDKYSWSSQLEKILNNKSQKIKFKVFNEGITATNTAFILSRLNKNLEKYNPDMVITMMGINDADMNLMYKKNIKNKICLIFQDFRIYKLSKLITGAFKIKKDKEYSTHNNNLNSLGNEEEMLKREIKKGTDNGETYDKLGKLYISQGRYNEAEEILKEGLEEDSDKEYIHELLGKVYINQGRYDEAEEILKEGLEKYPNKWYAYQNLGRLYIDQSRYNEAEEILKEGLEKYPEVHFYEYLGRLYIDQGRYNEAEEILKDGIKIKSDKEVCYSLLSLLYQKKLNEMTFLEEIYRKIDFKDNKIESLLEQKSIVINLEKREDYGRFSDITKYHYNGLYKELDKRDIKYIAMQYPTLDINDLKIMFDGDEDIVFISNKENFEKVLSDGDYWNYFTDKFAGDFGHCTPKGNELIAENVANVILKELNIEECD